MALNETERRSPWDMSKREVERVVTRHVVRMRSAEYETRAQSANSRPLAAYSDSGQLARRRSDNETLGCARAGGNTPRSPSLARREDGKGRVVVTAVRIGDA